jgi:hypothetical protein
MAEDACNRAKHQVFENGHEVSLSDKRVLACARSRRLNPILFSELSQIQIGNENVLGKSLRCQIPRSKSMRTTMKSLPSTSPFLAKDARNGAPN